MAHFDGTRQPAAHSERRHPAGHVAGNCFRHCPCAAGVFAGNSGPGASISNRQYLSDIIVTPPIATEVQLYGVSAPAGGTPTARTFPPFITKQFHP